ncbi:MAG: hypothetical protein IJG68_01105 [Bacilli bacterium]|nr:hypothetical protein [Bacilli bacterium]
MKKTVIILIITLTVFLHFPTNVEAFSTKENILTLEVSNKLVDSNKTTRANNNNSDINMNQYNQQQNCNTLLGNPEDPNSVAWLIQKILTYATIGGMVLVVVLSSVDFLKVIMNGSDDDMAKASKKLAMRLLLAALLFFVPTLTNTLLGLFGLTSDVTCGIN